MAIPAHNLNSAQLSTLRSLQQQGNYAEAWRQLSKWGDTYADDAANVTGAPSDFYGEFMNEMVRQHWENTAGESAYSQYFDSVASMHLNNYLTVMENTGGWPTSEQIEGSYRQSVEFYGLPPSTAFDGVFTQSVGTVTGGDYDWPHALDMDPDRIVPSDVFDDIGFVEASQTLAETIYDTIAEFVKRGWEWAQEVIKYATDAVLDLLDDVRRAALEKLRELTDSIRDTIEDVYDSVRDLFDNAKKFIPRRDPLVLDLDGDGIETVAATGAILFDHDGDGIRSGTGWIARDDGMLVLDRNGNGLIDNGGELFGADTVLSDDSKAASGFAALADLDSNEDGVFDAGDSEFADVRVWRDLNQDGISQAGELFTLDQLGIASINLTPSTTVDLDLGNGNVVDNRGTFTRADGTTGLAGDLLLAMSHFFSDFTGALEPVAVTDEAKRIPGLKGSGAVRDLVEAASLSGNLLSAVEALEIGVSRNAMRDQLDTIVSLWAGTSTMQSSEEVLEASGSVARTIYYHGAIPATVIAQGEVAVEAWKQQQHADLAPIIAIIEKFNGSSLISFQSDRVSTGGNTYLWKTVAHAGGSTEQMMSIVLQQEQISALLEAYADLKESVYARLVLGTRLGAYMDSLNLQLADGELQVDFSAFTAMLNGKRQINLGEALQDLVDLYRYGGNLLGSAGWNGAEVLASWISDAVTTHEGLQALAFAGIDLATGSLTGTSGNDVLWGNGSGNALRGGAGGDLLIGNAGNDSLSGESGRDILLGGLGSDTLNGGAGDDRLIGGLGNDNLTGGDGSDVYVYELGDGQDTINNYDVSAGRFDVLVLGEGISPNGVTATRLSNNLILSINGTTDRITVSNYFTSDGAGGYQLDQIRFADGTVWTVDILKPMVQIPTEGNDNLYGYAGNDTLAGLAGNDNIFGNGGDDILEGGLGNDSLSGGAGSDTYVFNAGDGQDTIDNYDTSIGRFDVLQFGEDIEAANVTVRRSGTNLLLTFAGSNDKVTISNYFNGDAAGGYQLNEIRFADGTAWNVADIKAAVLVPTENADNLYGYASDDTIAALGGNDTVYGYGGNDRLIGGLGNDTLDGGEGSDIYVFNLGDGQDTIQNYDSSASRVDAIEFGVGIEPENVLARRDGQSLVLTINGTDDKITVSNYFLQDAASHYRLEEVRFADGTAWNIELVKALVQVPTEGADKIYGYEINDALTGGGGNDTLYGNGGNDALTGGAGNDALDGGTGSDTYLFDVGDGQDTINNYDSGSGRVDVLLFGPNVDPANVTVRRINNHLVLAINETEDKVTVSNYFISDGAGGYQLDEIRFAGAPGTVWDVNAIKTLVLVPTSGNDTLQGYASADVIAGGVGNDTIYGNAGNDVLEGESGDDILSGGDGNDSLLGGEGDDSLNGDAGDDALHGGVGNDNLSGGAGSDTYLFNAGDGQDTIGNYDAGDGRVDVLLFGQTIDPANVTVRRINNHLVLTINGTDDKVTISNYFISDAAGGYQLDEIRFAGVPDTVWDVNAIKALVMAPTSGNDTLQGYASDDVIAGGAGNDTISGNAGNDVLKGEAGNDTLSGGEGNDSLLGGEGDDTLKGDAGDDVLHGGAGNDNLNGGIGSDTYLFNVGDGRDTISNYDAGDGRVDVLQFGQGILPADVFARRINDDLVLTFTGSTDKVTVSSYFANDAAGNYQLDQVRFADDTVWDVEAVKALVLLPTSGKDTLLGYASDDTIIGGEGDDTLYGNAGNDTLQGQDGNDTIFGGLGNDTISGGVGIDTLQGDEGDDVLDGGVGSDILRGGAGDDNLIGGLGNDQLEGGEGDDHYHFAVGDGQDILNDTQGLSTIHLSGVSTGDVYLRRDGTALLLCFVGSSTDQIRLVSFFDANTQLALRGLVIDIGDGAPWILDAAAVDAKTLLGTLLDDVIDGNTLDNTINGQAGNDTIRAGSGADMLDGGAGDDALYGQDGDDILIGGQGNDLLDGGTGSDQLSGGAGDDIYVVDDAGDVVGEVADGGIDLVRSSVSFALPDHVEKIELTGTADINATGNALDNTLTGNAGNNHLQGLDGNDTLMGGAGEDWLQGGNGNDVLNGGEGADLLDGGAGNDVLDGSLGIDQLVGGSGDDLYRVDDSADVVIELAGEGTDTVQSSAYSYTLSDNIENLILVDYAYEGVAGAGSQALTGNQHGNRLDGGAGADNLIGGLGDDTYVVDNVGDVVVELANEGTDTVESSISYTLGETLENLTLLGTADLNATGNAGENLIRGNAGYNRIEGGAGADVMYGGAGDDYYVAVSAEDSVHEYADEGIDTIERVFETNLVLEGNVENLILGSGVTTGNGNALNNVITGNAGNNSLGGWDGDDTLYGLDGDDNLFGGNGADTLYGGVGNDYLDGGAGVDHMEGGTGDDNYIVNHADDVIVEAANAGTDQVQASASYVLSENLENLFLTGSVAISGTGNALDNYIAGNSAANVINGGAGNDTLVGGGDNDTLIGGTGDDKYIFDATSGSDVIDNSDGGFDGVFFTNGITRERLSFGRDGDDLVIFIDAASTPAVRVLDHFLGGNAAIDYVQPDGGFYLTTAQINQLVAGGSTGGEYDQVIEGTSAAEQLVGSSGKDLIKGLAGNDQLFGMGGNDTLQGGDGNDYLSGGSGSGSGSGDDRLEGGAGADTLVGEDGVNALIGGAGNDNYVYGGGQDTIDNTGGGTDGVFFDNGITANDLTFYRDGDDLVITVDDNASGFVRVTDHFLGGDMALDFVQPSSGNMLNTAAINALAQSGYPGGGEPGGGDPGPGTGNPGDGVDEGNDNDYPNVVTGTANGEQLLGSSGRDLITGMAGNDTMFGFGGDDKLVGGDGDDYLSGGNGSYSGSGNDILIGGNGNDTLVGEDGDDTMFGGAGDDKYVYGGGADVIDNSGGGTDWLLFNSASKSINRTRLSFHQDGDDLVIMVDSDAGQQVRVYKHFDASGDYAIDYVQPADGYGISAASINALLTPLPSAQSMLAPMSLTDASVMKVLPDMDSLMGVPASMEVQGGGMARGGSGAGGYVPHQLIVDDEDVLNSSLGMGARINGRPVFDLVSSGHSSDRRDLLASITPWRPLNSDWATLPGLKDEAAWHVEEQFEQLMPFEMDRQGMTANVDMPVPVMREQFITRSSELQQLIDAMAGYGDIAQSGQETPSAEPTLFGIEGSPNQSFHLLHRHQGMTTFQMM